MSFLKSTLTSNVCHKRTFQMSLYRVHTFLYICPRQHRKTLSCSSEIDSDNSGHAGLSIIILPVGMAQGILTMVSDVRRVSFSVFGD